jgi:hypothetical protein
MNPLHIISLGAGVQSSTMALMAAAGEIAPMPHCAIFADTQAEPASVYKWLDWLETQLPFPVHRVTAGSLTETALAMKTTADGRRFSKTDIPFFTRNEDGQLGKITNRGCTRDFKLLPLRQRQRHEIGAKAWKEWRLKHADDLAAVRDYEKEMKQWRKNEKAGIHRPAPSFPRCYWARMQADALVVSWIGISLDEVIRMKDSRDPWARSSWPLVESRLSRNNCLLWMERRGFPVPPRSACVYCPFHNNHEWRRLKHEEPAEFSRAVEFERALRATKAESDNFATTPFLHRDMLPLDEVDLSTDNQRGQELFQFANECEGMCGV